MVTLTILGIEQHLVELGLVVIKGLSDFVHCLLIRQVTVHEAAKWGRENSEKQAGALLLLVDREERKAQQ